MRFDHRERRKVTWIKKASEQAHHAVLVGKENKLFMLHKLLFH